MMTLVKIPWTVESQLVQACYETAIYDHSRGDDGVGHSVTKDEQLIPSKSRGRS